MNTHPTKIVGTYTEDYDITYVHNIIINTLQKEKSIIKELEAKLNSLNQQLQKPQTVNQRRDIEEDIQQLTQCIMNIREDVKINTYRKQSQPYITEYRYLKSRHQPVLSIIHKYLTLAKQYIVIEVTRIINMSDCCMNCQTPLLNSTVNGDGVIRCPECGNEHQTVNTTKVNDGNKDQNLNTENDMENFMKALTRYQGLQPNPPMIIYTKLDTYFRQRKLPTSTEIKALPYNDRGKKGNTNKEMLCQALAQIGYASYYEDVNLIGHVYWDWKLPDLTGLKDIILRHYTITQKSFYKIPLEVRGRISSLGTQYRLWRHLQLIGHICYSDDFKIAENIDSLQNHHRLWKLMCELSNDPDIYYID